MVHHVVIVVLHVRFIGRWSFAFWFYGYKRHPTLRAFAWIIRYNFRMHRAGVFLFLLMLLLLLVLAMRAIAVNRPYLRADVYCERNCTDQNRNPFLHVACMF